MSKFKTITHVIAVIITAVVGFLMTPVGIAIVHQYPKLGSIVSGLGAVIALYYTPKERV